MCVVCYCGHAQQHENDCLRNRGRHFQEVLDGGVRLLADITVYISPHYHATAGTAGTSIDNVSVNNFFNNFIKTINNTILL